MRHTDNSERARRWIVDYSIARAKAIKWLGDRYLLAKPVNRRSPATYSRSDLLPSKQHPVTWKPAQ